MAATARPLGAATPAAARASSDGLTVERSMTSSLGRLCRASLALVAAAITLPTVVAARTARYHLGRRLRRVDRGRVPRLRWAGVLAIGLLPLSESTSSAGAQVVRVRLTSLTANVFPEENPAGLIPISDETDFFGLGAGTPLGLRATSVSLFTTSGVADANLGTVDITNGGFALNWGFVANLNVFNGTALVGTAQASGVLREAGAFDPVTGIGTSATAAPQVAVFDLFRGVGTGARKRTNTTVNNVNIFGAIRTPTGFDGTFLSPTDLDVTFDSDLGGGTQQLGLTGGFTLTAIPEPFSASLLLTGLAVLAAGRMLRQRRR